MQIAACYWGHDSNISFWSSEQPGHIRTIEIEKLEGFKHYRGHMRRDKERDVLKKCFDIAEREWGFTREYDVWINGHSDSSCEKDYWDMQIEARNLCLTPHIILEFVTVKKFHTCKRHHMAHAYSVASQSDFESAVVFTADGTGNDGKTHIFEWVDGKCVPVTPPWDPTAAQFGQKYHWNGALTVPDIAYATPIHLDLPGKIMGAAAYGRKYKEDFEGNPLPEVNEWYKLGYELWGKGAAHPHVNWLYPALKIWDKLLKDHTRYAKHFSSKINADWGVEANNLYDMMLGDTDIPFELQCDMALGFNTAHCDNVRYYLANKIERTGLLDKHNRNIILGGGCALNLIANRIIQDNLKANVHAFTNPADYGLSMGMVVQYLAENDIPHTINPDQIAYSGPRLLDEDNLENYIEERNGTKTTFEELSVILRAGGIIGLVQGGVETGARALGNRSLIADPKYPEMKDRLNEIKRREGYRPFAPVCRREDVEKFFEADSYDNLSYMNIECTTRPQMVGFVAAATHVNGTARLQTVKESQNKNLWDLLSYFKRPLMNTSFNVGGKPILNTLVEAFYMLDETPLKYLVIIDKNNQSWLFEKDK